MMQTAFWLYFDGRGGVRATKRKGAVRADEVAICATVNIPKSYFDRPAPLVMMTLPDQPDPQPIEVTVAEDNIRWQDADLPEYHIVERDGGFVLARKPGDETYGGGDGADGDRGQGDDQLADR